jgi:uncharacterized OsmC-like protein
MEIPPGEQRVRPDPAHGPDAAPTAYQIRARTVGEGRAEAVAGTQVIPFDAGWGRPPTGLPGPAELLASAFAACLLKNLERTSQRLQFQYDGAEVDVTLRRQDAPPKFTEVTYELRLRTDEPEQRIDLVHRNLRKFGTVYNTLAPGCAIEGRIVAAPPGAAR